MYGFTNNFYSSGDEGLEIDTNGVPYVIETAWDLVSPLIGFDADVRRNTWQKQEFYKGRSWVYGTGWAGWGFESNVTAQAVNAAAPATLLNAPIFEHDPAEMFLTNIAQSMQNSIIAKGIPALSLAVGSNPLQNILSNGKNLNMNDENDISRRNGWPRHLGEYASRWLHTDLHNLSFYFTFGFYEVLAQKMEE